MCKCVIVPAAQQQVWFHSEASFLNERESEVRLHEQENDDEWVSSFTLFPAPIGTGVLENRITWWKWDCFNCADMYCAYVYVLCWMYVGMLQYLDKIEGIVGLMNESITTRKYFPWYPSEKIASDIRQEIHSKQPDSILKGGCGLFGTICKKNLSYFETG